MLIKPTQAPCSPSVSSRHGAPVPGKLQRALASGPRAILLFCLLRGSVSIHSRGCREKGEKSDAHFLGPGVWRGRGLCPGGGVRTLV